MWHSGVKLLKYHHYSASKFIFETSQYNSCFLGHLPKQADSMRIAVVGWFCRDIRRLDCRRQARNHTGFDLGATARKKQQVD
jgi:hypothetical protein